MAKALTECFPIGTAWQYPEPRPGAMCDVRAEGDASQLPQMALQLPWCAGTDW